MSSTSLLLDNIVNGYKPKIKELQGLLILDNEQSNELFSVANQVTKNFFNNEVHIRGIIEFSNYCRCNCQYCGLNKKNKILTRYRMGLDEIILSAEEAYKSGYRTIILQSGEDLWYTKDKVLSIVKEIKKLGDIAITLSIGERSFEEYETWYNAGAERYLIKHETADYQLYNLLHPHSNYNQRIKAIKNIKKLGYQLGGGFIIGLPGQTMQTIAKDILLLKSLNADMVGIGPLIPHNLSSLQQLDRGNTDITLRAIALTRILLKDVHLPATTALGVASVEAFEKAFSIGANVIMHKIEPYEYRKLYDIYPRESDLITSVEEERLSVESFIKSLGKEVATGKGDSLKIRGKNDD